MSRVAILVVCIMLACLLLLGAWWGLSPDAARSSGNAVGNRTDPAAQIIGSTACAECHRDIAEKYDSSGHAHTFHVTTDEEIASRLAGKSFHDPQRRQRFEYRLNSDGLEVALPAVFGEEGFPLQYALGSGTHATTFLTLLPHLEGETVGLEHRVSFYHQLAGLDLTVGHPFLKSPTEDAEYFGKVLDSQKLKDCIGCHTTQATIRNHELVNVIPHVGCESCHGPGSVHAQASHQGHPVGSYAITARWPTALDELQTCGRCHRMPESLKPSELVRSSRVLPRFQPAGLMQSRCYTESKGALRCTTCHDPHTSTSHDAARYNVICQQCHREQMVPPCPSSTTDCTTCHMPPIPFEGVAAFHDHWIRIRNQDDPAPATASDLPSTDAQ